MVKANSLQSNPFRSFLAAEVLGPPAQGLQAHGTESYVLRGVVWGEQPHAMLTDPGGRSYVVELGTYVGRSWGKVTAIHSDRVVVTEEYQTIDGELVVLRVELVLAP